MVAGHAHGVVVVEGAQYSGSVITARMALELGREAFGVPGMTQPGRFAPNQRIRQGAKLVTNGEDTIEDLPTPIRAAWYEPSPEAEQRTLSSSTWPPQPAGRRFAKSTGKKLYKMLTIDQPVHIDDIVERSSLNSSEVLATLFDLERKGIVRQLPGKQFGKVLQLAPRNYCKD
jgi:DNA processing protein